MRSKGFTLIEVILTIVILAIAIPGLISAVGFMTSRQVNTVGTTTAADLAQEKMEEIMGDRNNPGRGFGYIIAGNYPAENPVTGFTKYNRSVTITCFTNNALTTTAACPTDYKQVQVTVQASGVGPSVPAAVLVSLVTNH
ncbi:MAG TPA: prepilin-type N-terminal cleavage/methylation domain-containing protein [Nitrospiria bacterium]|nr:prepilin-type N-terminal cleavage/methylation domain-containing protein [Nitrospiria bacterium]